MAAAVYRFSGVAAWICVIVGFAVLAGWVFDVQLLKSVAPGLVSMKVNTAIGFVLAGGSLRLVRDERASPPRRLVGGALGGVIALLALITLAEYVLATDLRIDHVFSDGGASLPGRPSPHTALAFLAVGVWLSLLSLRDSGPARLRGWVSAIASVTVLQAAIGYLYGVNYLYGLSAVTGMAVHTMVTFVILCLGVLAARPRQGLIGLLTSTGIGGLTARRLTPAIVVLPLLLGYLRLKAQQHGLIGLRDGISILAGGTVVGVGAIVIYTGLSLNRADALRVASDNERRLQAQITAELSEGVLVTRWSDSTVVYANERFEEMLRVTAGTLIGTDSSVIDLVGVDRAQLIADARAAMLEQGHWSGDLEFRRADDSSFMGHVTLSGFEHPDHGTLSVLVVADVTEERAARVTLQAADERFRCSFEEARIGMMIIDLDGRYERVNDAFCDIVGYTHEQLVGLARASITHPDDVAADADAMTALLAGEATSHTCEKRYLHTSGHPVWAQLNLTLIRDADNQPLHFIAQVQDITERRSYEHQLQHMADHDPLTGLLNRRSFQRELNSHIARVARYGTTGAVLMVDLDNFKYFNDTQGHNAGDELIVRIAQGLRSRLRDSDVLARLGGDEFAILLPHEDEQEAQTVADALLALVRDEDMPALIGKDKRVTASVGIARFSDGDDVSAEDMMVNADLAMYDAKEAGGDRYARYRTEQHDRPKIESRMKWAEQINDAIASDGFELLAQPIVALAGNGPAQYELLLRMRDPHGGLIPPGSFLYIAERLGLIREIDQWVTHRAIDMLAEHRAQGRDLRLEVNLSGHTIGDPQLLELVKRLLNETGVPADRLIFEITETAAIAHIARAATFAEQLSQLGCKFALDDFGAGFGSFYYLKHLPFDYLKIDGEFVRHCANNDTDRTLIAAVVQIARGMGKRTIAEFVTDQETVEVLTRLGVDYGQGFHLGRPAPIAEHLAAGTAAPTPRTTRRPRPRVDS